MAAKNTIEGATGVRRTRAANILTEFDRNVEVNEVAEKLKTAINDATEVSVLLHRTTMQIRNIDSLTSKDELVEDMRREDSEWWWHRGEVTENGVLRNSGGGGGAICECGS
jgi:5,10-methenyltetrahydromethanopterin hydrogenase